MRKLNNPDVLWITFGGQGIFEHRFDLKHQKEEMLPGAQGICAFMEAMNQFFAHYKGCFLTAVSFDYGTIHYLRDGLLQFVLIIYSNGLLQLKYSDHPALFLNSIRNRFVSIYQKNNLFNKKAPLATEYFTMFHKILDNLLILKEDQSYAPNKLEEPCLEPLYSHEYGGYAWTDYFGRRTIKEEYCEIKISPELMVDTREKAAT